MFLSLQLQLTRASNSTENDSTSGGVMVPVVHDINANKTQMARRSEQQQASDPSIRLSHAINELMARPVLPVHESSVYPCVRELLMHLNVGPDGMPYPPTSQTPTQPPTLPTSTSQIVSSPRLASPHNMASPHTPVNVSTPSSVHYQQNMAQASPIMQQNTMGQPNTLGQSMRQGGAMGQGNPMVQVSNPMVQNPSMGQPNQGNTMGQQPNMVQSQSMGQPGMVGNFGMQGPRGMQGMPGMPQGMQPNMPGNQGHYQFVE